MSEEQKPDLSVDDPGFTEADIARDEARPNHWGALAELAKGKCHQLRVEHISIRTCHRFSSWIQRWSGDNW